MLLSPDALLVNPHPVALAGWCTDRLYEAGGESGVGALGSQFGTPERSGQALAVAVCLGYIAGSAAAKWARSRRQLQARHRCSLVMRAPHAAGACDDGSGRQQRRTEEQAAAQECRGSAVAFIEFRSRCCEALGASCCAADCGQGSDERRCQRHCKEAATS